MLATMYTFMLVAWENTKKKQYSVVLVYHLVDGTLRRSGKADLIGLVADIYWPSDKKIYKGKIISLGNVYRSNTTESLL